MIDWASPKPSKALTTAAHHRGLTHPHTELPLAELLAMVQPSKLSNMPPPDCLASTTPPHA